MLVNNFRGQVCDIAADSTGHHVVQRFFQYHQNWIDGILEEICLNFSECARHKFMMMPLKDIINLRNT